MIRVFLLLGNLAGMVWIILNAETRKEMIWPSLALVAIGVFFLFNFVEGLRKKYFKDTFPSMAYLWCAIAWSRTMQWWFAPLMIIFFVLDIMAHRPLVINVSPKGITYPSLIEKSINWMDLNNVILKDDLLTLDFKNNRLLQLLVTSTETDINEKEFNEFCKDQLKKPAAI